MKKIFVLVLSIIIAVPAFAAETLDWGQALHSGPSACPDGALVLNVTQKVVNAVDSGTTRPVWAFDDYIRQIRVVDTGSGLCATVKYEGNFTSIAGDDTRGRSGTHCLGRRPPSGSQVLPPNSHR